MIKVLINNKIYDLPFRNFPAGEESVILSREVIDLLKDNPNRTVKVIFLSADSETIMRGILVGDAIKQITNSFVNAIIDYFPYGRQDRVCKEGEPFSLVVIIKMLSIAFVTVETHDIHSVITKDLCFTHGLSLRGTEALYCSEYIGINSAGYGSGHLITDIVTKGSIIVSPDKGAADRTKSLSILVDNPNILYLDKVRTEAGVSVALNNMITEEGYVEIYKYIAQEIKDNANYIISDDICDGGGTFFAAMDKIREINPKATFTLIFSHGIFSKGLDKFWDYCDEIYVVDDYYNQNRLDIIL